MGKMGKKVGFFKKNHTFAILNKQNNNIFDPNEENPYTINFYSCRQHDAGSRKELAGAATGVCGPTLWYVHPF
jgi:hypothetical protein